MTDAPLPEDPRDALIREQAERLAVQDRQLVQVAVQAEQLAHGPSERWLVDGDVRPGRSDDDVAMNGDSPYRFG